MTVAFRLKLMSSDNARPPLGQPNTMTPSSWQVSSGGQITSHHPFMPKLTRSFFCSFLHTTVFCLLPDFPSTASAVHTDCTRNPLHSTSIGKSYICYSFSLCSQMRFWYFRSFLSWSSSVFFLWRSQFHNGSHLILILPVDSVGSLRCLDI